MKAYICRVCSDIPCVLLVDCGANPPQACPFPLDYSSYIPRWKEFELLSLLKGVGE